MHYKSRRWGWVAPTLAVEGYGGNFRPVELKRVQTHTMTIYTAAKINRKMGPNWPETRSPGEVGTALRSIFKMLRNAVPNSPGDRF